MIKIDVGFDDKTDEPRKFPRNSKVSQPFFSFLSFSILFIYLFIYLFFVKNVYWKFCMVVTIPFINKRRTYNLYAYWAFAGLLKIGVTVL